MKTSVTFYERYPATRKKYIKGLAILCNGKQIWSPFVSVKRNAFDSSYFLSIAFNMEEKLEEFKRRRRKELFFKKHKLFFRGIMKNIPGLSPSQVPQANDPLLDNSTQNYEGGSDSEISSVLSDDSVNSTITCLSWYELSTYISYFLLWLIVYMIAIHYEFGYVYLVVSGLVFIYLNTRTGPKRKDEISAYSVFNPNCHAIDGTLKAEQFEREFNLIKHEV